MVKQLIIFFRKMLFPKRSQKVLAIIKLQSFSAELSNIQNLSCRMISFSYLINLLSFVQILCYGLSLPLSDVDTIKDCVNIYCEWLTCLLPEPKRCVPKPILHAPNDYASSILCHLHNVFVPRLDGGRMFSSFFLKHFMVKSSSCGFYILILISRFLLFIEIS